MSKSCDIAIIGAGPYGLSISACLTAHKAPHRIFGRAMETWATQMPKGMELKSDGFASNLRDSIGQHTFARYCREHAIPYADLGIPPKLDDFISYGRDFQKTLVPHLEELHVSNLTREGDGFKLTFETGPDCLAKSVVVAAGISHFAHMPDVFAGLPRSLVTHSSENRNLEKFKGRKVAVIGAGSSAADVAGLLHEQGAEVHLIARGSQIPFHTKMRVPRPLYDRLRWPSSTIGPSWRSLAFVKGPLVFHRLSEAKRLQIARTYLGPAPGYFMRDKVIGRVNIHLGLEVQKALPNGQGGVELTLANNGGETRLFTADHVICGTGYKAELARLPFLDQSLVQRLKHVHGTPVLSSHFESSVPGLYFVGALTVNSFGPVVRFACGTEFTAPRIARHLAPNPMKIHLRRLFGSKPQPAATIAVPQSATASENRPV